MKLRPYGNRVLCRLVELGDNYGHIVIPERFRKRFGITATGAPHALCRIEDLGPEACKELSVGDYVLVDGLNIENISPSFVQGERDICLPLDRAILVRFTQPPVA